MTETVALCCGIEVEVELMAGVLVGTSVDVRACVGTCSDVGKGPVVSAAGLVATGAAREGATDEPAGAMARQEVNSMSKNIGQIRLKVYPHRYTQHR